MSAEALRIGESKREACSHQRGGEIPGVQFSRSAAEVHHLILNRRHETIIVV